MTLKITFVLATLCAGAAGVVAAGIYGANVSNEGVQTQIFINPTIHGAGIDVRYAKHMAANPYYTANRFCLDRGFSRVTDYSVRTAGLTVTLGDQHRQAAEREHLSAFSLIECGFASDLG